MGAEHTNIRRPTTPGEILRHEFLEANGITQDRLAKAMGVSRFRVNEIINGKRAVTSETALLLGRALGTSADVWLDLQRAVDLYDARSALNGQLDSVDQLIPIPPTKKIFFDLPRAHKPSRD